MRPFKYIACVIAKEISGPITDVAVCIHLERFNLGFAIVGLAGIERHVIRRNFALSYATRQTVEQMLAVAFKDNLDTTICHDINEDIRQLRLDFRMEVGFGLFENKD